MRIKTPVLILLLIALMSLSVCLLTACRNENGPDTDTSAPTDAPTDAPTEAPTDADTEPVAPAELTITPETYVAVLSDYAAEWEKAAASALTEKLGLTLVSDKQVPEGRKKLLIGWTAFNADMSADFAKAGREGYLFSCVNEDVLLGANTEAGMNNALNSFNAALKDGVLNAADAVSVEDNRQEQPVTLSGPWGASVARASEMANGVTTTITDKNRFTWVLSNKNVVITYEDKKKHTFTSVTTPDGIPYLTETLDVYILDGDSGLHWSNEHNLPGHFNTMQLGYYYYNAHVFDEGFGKDLKKAGLQGVALDRVFNMYSDKLNMVQHIVPTQKEITNILAYGMIMKVPAERVTKLIVSDASGLHDSLSGVDFDTVEYVAFDIERAGILGYILACDEGSGTLTVTLEDGFYVVDQHIDNDPQIVYTPGSHINFGQRLYTDTNHTFDAFVKEAEAERHPLQGITITEDSDGARFVGYDGLRGAYEFKLNGSDFNKAYYKEPDKHYALHAAITCDDEDRNIWVFTHTSSGGLECAALLDENDSLIPIPLEVNKNFAGENEEAYYFPGDPGYGMTFFPLSLKKDQTLPFTVLNLYQNWGQFPLKQLSSISFVSPYYHLSTGVTETNCIAPTYVFGKDFWLLPDFRSMSAPLWSDQPQHTSIGRLYVVTYDQGTLENTKNTIDSSGPVYADISLEYADLNGLLDVTYRHVEMPQTDENRTYYTLDITINQEFTVKRFSEKFNLFTFDSRDVLFGKMGYLNENNEPAVDTLDLSASYRSRMVKLGDEYPYYDYYGVTNSGNTVNFGLIVKDYDIVLGGEQYTGGFMVRDEFVSGLNRGSLTLDIDSVTLKPGDHIHVDYILMPWGCQTARNDENVKKVRQDSCIDPYLITAAKGEVIPDTYVPKVRMKDGNAEFTLSGGDNTAVVRVYGMTGSARPALFEKVNGEWVEYKTDKKGYDGGMIYYDGDGTYSFAFCVDMSGGEARTFKVTEAK